MKYRSKLYIALVATTLVSTLAGLGVTYWHMRKVLLVELQSKVISIAASTAITLDPKMVDQVIKSPQKNNLAYLELQSELVKSRDANRRKDVYVKYVYILSQIVPNSNHFSYLVDAEESSSPNYSPLGESADVEAVEANLVTHKNQAYSPSRFISDQWGDWMTAYAPIYDNNGKYLATLGINIFASNVMSELHKLLGFGLFAFLLTLIIALIAGWFLSRHETIALQALHDGVRAIDGGDLAKRIVVLSEDEFAELAVEINHMAQGLQEKERLRSNFARYVSQHVMESITSSDGPLKLSGERRKVTLLFSDIRQFTKLAEKSDPEQVVQILNEYFSSMVEIIFRNHGMLDKFLGDGIMVEFGAPLDDANQEYHAVKTALEMQEGLQLLCEKWQSEGKPSIQIGIGIHTGFAVVGNIGSERRIEYTAIGDTVNVASRLEQFTKELKVPILISESTVQAIQDKFNFKNLGPQTLRGRTDPIVVYTIE